MVIPAREAAIWDALAEVSDPEIPAISLVDLGVIRSVQLEAGRLTVELLPTFVGCPAVEVMRHDVAERLRGMADEVDVRISFAEPWTSERISARGRERLRASGFAPPVRIGPAPLAGDLAELSVLPIATCPYCGSRNTSLENPFGPTLCRAIYHCADCRQPFEQFKAV
jgi:ring-1,2-phenylacetyl-CoA epoxidase subunit PaaD